MYTLASFILLFMSNKVGTFISLLKVVNPFPDRKMIILHVFHKTNVFRQSAILAKTRVRITTAAAFSRQNVTDLHARAVLRVLEILFLAVVLVLESKGL